MSSLAAQAPDLGTPEFATVSGFALGVIVTGVALALRLSREEVEWAGFLGVFFGGAAGLADYLVGLITGLY